MARTYQHLEYTEQPTRAPLLRWSSVIGGVVIGTALLALLSTLWVALAEATNVEAIADGLGWFIAASAIVALFIGGWIAGALSGVPGIWPGIMNGLAVWGLFLVLSALVGAPGALSAWTAPGLDLPALEASEALWPAFWSLLVGAVTAAIGGAIGGLTTRGEPAMVPTGAVEERGGDRYRDERDRDERDRDRDERYRDERYRQERYRDEREYAGGSHARPEERGWRDERGWREERDPRPTDQVPPSERAYSERQQGDPSDRRPS